MKAWRPRPVGRSGNPALISGLVVLLWLPLTGLAQLNDTGVDRYSNSSSFTPTEPADFPGQDPSYGRDAAAAAGQLPKVGGGAKGFDFTKLDSNGNPLPASASSWTCVRDNVTGLEWEVKTDDGGLRDKDWGYSWYSTDSPGYETPSNNPADCGNTLTHCNTQEYAAAVNQTSLCGHADWRLPTIEELRSIVDYGINYPGPIIDINYFPNTVNSEFWSSAVYAGNAYFAWFLNFYFGDDGYNAFYKDHASHVRLVRGGQPPVVGTPSSRTGCAETIPESTPTTAFTRYSNGTAVHQNTGLMWMRCTLGQTWNGSTCTGSATAYYWQQALQQAASATFAGYGDWRLPNIKELSSIAERRCLWPAINATVFPNAPSSWFWSSSVVARHPYYAWYLDFGYGYVGLYFMNYGAAYVRLVRGGQSLPFDYACVSGINPSQAEHPAQETTSTVAVSATGDCAWLAVSNAPWLQIQSGATGLGNGVVTYRVETNTLPNSRSGALTIAGGTFTVFQAGTGSVAGPGDLRGTIRDATAGQPLGGANVQLGTLQTTSQAGTGAYAFTGVAAGNYSLTVSKDGYSTVVQNVTLSPLTSAVRDVGLRQDTASPRVTHITTRYDKGFYVVDGRYSPEHTVDFTTHIDWAGKTPQTARLTTDHHVYDVPAASSQVVKPLNVKDEFVTCGGLQAQALWADGESPPVRANFGVMSNPLGDIPWALTDKGDDFAYKPRVWVDMDFFGSDAASAIVVPDKVPLIGGHNIKFEFFPRLEAELVSDGTFRLQLEAALRELEQQAWGPEKNVAKLMALYKDYLKRGKVDRRRIPKQYMAGVEFEIFPYLQVNKQFSDKNCAWDWDGAHLGLVSELKKQITRPMITLAGPVPVPWYAKASLGVGLQGELGLTGLTTQSARWDGELTLEPELRGAIGVGVDALIALEGWLSGRLTEGWRFNENPAPIVADFTLAGGARAYALMFEYDFGSLEWHCDLIAGDCTGPGLDAAAFARTPRLAAPASTSRLIPRRYLNAPGYGSFPAAAAPVPRAALAAGAKAAAATQTAAVQEVVFPQSQATLSAAGTHLQAAWLYDEPSRSAINRTVVVFSPWQGEAWGPFAPIADDGTADFHPRLATFADGSTVAAWEDVNAVLPDTATLEDMAAALEISVGMRNGQTGQWQTQRLTSNAILDRSPRLAGVPGDLWVTWVENAGNDLRGAAAAPNVVKAAHWNGTAWSATQALATFGEGLVRYEVAYNGSQGAVVMNLDLDGDSATVADQELFVIPYAGGTWGGLERLTNDAVVDDNPKLAVNGDGELTVVWLRDGSVVSAPLNDIADLRTVYASEYSSHLADFQLAAGPEGQMAVVWAEPDEFTSDLTAIFYDPDRDLWGEPRPLTADAELEKYLTAAFTADGLVVLYNRSPVTEVPQTVQKTLSGGQVSLTVPQTGLTDLYMTWHPITRGAAVKAGSLTLFPTNPKPGDPALIEAVIVNTGDTALANVAVNAYLGDPQLGGALIAQTALSEPLGPWSSREISLSWTVPATNTPLTLFLVVDPEQLIDDFDRADNSASLTTVLSDLTIANRRWAWLDDAHQHLSLVARVLNQGALAAAGGALTVRQGAADGPVLATLPFGPLAVGQAVDLPLTWEPGGLPGPTSDFLILEETRLAL